MESSTVSVAARKTFRDGGMPTWFDQICDIKHLIKVDIFLHNQASVSRDLKSLLTGTRPMIGCLALRRVLLTHESTAQTLQHKPRCRGLNSRGVHSRRRTLPNANSRRDGLYNCRVRNAYTHRRNYGIVVAA